MRKIWRLPLYTLYSPNGWALKHSGWLLQGCTSSLCVGQRWYNTPVAQNRNIISHSDLWLKDRAAELCCVPTQSWTVSGLPSLYMRAVFQKQSQRYNLNSDPKASPVWQQNQSVPNLCMSPAGDLNNGTYWGIICVAGSLPWHMFPYSIAWFSHPVPENKTKPTKEHHLDRWIFKLHWAVLQKTRNSYSNTWTVLCDTRLMGRGEVGRLRSPHEPGLKPH